MTRAVVVGEWLKCPYCHSTNIVVDGEYVCRECGAVLGPVFLPPIVELAPAKQASASCKPASPVPAPLRRAFEWYREYMAILEQEGRRRVKRRYLDMVREHLDKVAVAFGGKVVAVALEIFQRLDKRVYQAKSPRVVAATLAYLATQRLGMNVRKRAIAEIPGVSALSIRDTAYRFRKHLRSRSKARA